MKKKSKNPFEDIWFGDEKIESFEAFKMLKQMHITKIGFALVCSLLNYKKISNDKGITKIKNKIKKENKRNRWNNTTIKKEPNQTEGWLTRAQIKDYINKNLNQLDIKSLNITNVSKELRKIIPDLIMNKSFEYYDKKNNRTSTICMHQLNPKKFTVLYGFFNINQKLNEFIDSDYCIDNYMFLLAPYYFIMNKLAYLTTRIIEEHKQELDSDKIWINKVKKEFSKFTRQELYTKNLETFSDVHISDKNQIPALFKNELKSPLFVEFMKSPKKFEKEVSPIFEEYEKIGLERDHIRYFLLLGTHFSEEIKSIRNKPEKVIDKDTINSLYKPLYNKEFSYFFRFVTPEFKLINNNLDIIYSFMLNHIKNIDKFVFDNYKQEWNRTRYLEWLKSKRKVAEEILAQKRSTILQEDFTYCDHYDINSEKFAKELMQIDEKDNKMLEEYEREEKLVNEYNKKINKRSEEEISKK